MTCRCHKDPLTTSAPLQAIMVALTVATARRQVQTCVTVHGPVRGDEVAAVFAHRPGPQEAAGRCPAAARPQQRGGSAELQRRQNVQQRGQHGAPHDGHLQGQRVEDSPSVDSPARRFGGRTWVMKPKAQGLAGC